MSTWISRTLARRLEKKAEATGITLTELITQTYDEATRGTELTPDDYRQIALDTEKAQAGIDLRLAEQRTAREARKARARQQKGKA